MKGLASFLILFVCIALATSVPAPRKSYLPEFVVIPHTRGEVTAAAALPDSSTHVGCWRHEPCIESRLPMHATPWDDNERDYITKRTRAQALLTQLQELRTRVMWRMHRATGSHFWMSTRDYDDEAVDALVQEVRGYGEGFGCTAHGAGGPSPYVRIEVPPPKE